MRRTPFLCSLAVLLSASASAQTAPPTPPASPAPSAKPAAPPRAAASATAKPITITIQVTDASGAPLADTTVTTITGVVSREGVTAADGSTANDEHAARHLPAAIRARRVDYARARADRPCRRGCDGRGRAECGAAAPESSGTGRRRRQLRRRWDLQASRR